MEISQVVSRLTQAKMHLTHCTCNIGLAKIGLTAAVLTHLPLLCILDNVTEYSHTLTGVKARCLQAMNFITNNTRSDRQPVFHGVVNYGLGATCRLRK